MSTDSSRLTQKVKGDFVYRFDVPPVTYNVTSDQSCAPVKYVTVHIGKTAQVDLFPSYD